jgi:hypothetical protein
MRVQTIIQWSSQALSLQATENATDAFTAFSERHCFVCWKLVADVYVFRRGVPVKCCDARRALGKREMAAPAASFNEARRLPEELAMRDARPT